MIKIVVTGPESSGKTTLAKALAEYYNTVWVPEYAREYLEKLNRDYVKKDLLKIAKGQVKKQKTYLAKAEKIIFFDTSMLVMKIWSEYRYRHCYKWIKDEFQRQNIDLYVLCNPDIPWEDDPLRENPSDRDKLYEIYKAELIKSGKTFIEVKGNLTERIDFVVERIEVIF